MVAKAHDVLERKPHVVAHRDAPSAFATGRESFNAELLGREAVEDQHPHFGHQ